MKKLSIILLALVLVSVLCVVVYFSVLEEEGKPSGGTSTPSTKDYVKLAQEIIPNVNPYEIGVFINGKQIETGEIPEPVEVTEWETEAMGKTISEIEPLPPGANIDSLKGKRPHSIILANPPEVANELCKGAKELTGLRDDYHLMTMEEWGIIAQAIKQEGKTVRGNNNYGGSFEVPAEKCEKTPTIFVRDKCFTGTGPEAWCYQGICDLNGNLAEWVDFPRVVDGVVKLDGKEFTLVPANYDMEKVLGKEGVESLIKENDPAPNNQFVSGASVLVDTESAGFNYPQVVPIKRDTVLGDFDQFRNGDGVKYGDGKYYLWVPTYDRNNNGIEEETEKYDIWFEVLACDDFDGNRFSDCKHHRGCELEKSQIKTNQRISSVAPSFLSPRFSGEWDCLVGGNMPLVVPSIFGYINSLREEPELENLAIPASISLYGSDEFFRDSYQIVPSGIRYAARGGSIKDKEGSGVFNLDVSYEDAMVGFSTYRYGFRCVKDY